MGRCCQASQPLKAHNQPHGRVPLNTAQGSAPLQHILHPTQEHAGPRDRGGGCDGGSTSVVSGLSQAGCDNIVGKKLT
jgi:hypothetical protein